MVTKQRKILLIIILFTLFPLSLAVAAEQGGYAGTEDEGHDTAVMQFLYHFYWDDFYYAETKHFGTENNDYVDAMDIVYFCGHGCPYALQMSTGFYASLINVFGDDNGFGDRDLEFLIVHSCETVPSPIEKTDWADWWYNETSIWDGLHSLCGFRTDSWQSTDSYIADAYGDYIDDDGRIMWSWIQAIFYHGRDDEKGACVYYPDCYFETLNDYGADPPDNTDTLNIWYML
jgi:hypothetical protein